MELAFDALHLMLLQLTPIDHASDLRPSLVLCQPQDMGLTRWNYSGHWRKDKPSKA